MNLRDRSPRRPLALLLLTLTPACVPGSLKLGDDDPPGSSGSTSGEATETADTGEPTTGEPAPEGVLEWSKQFADIDAIDMAIAGDGSIIVIGKSGYSYNGGDWGTHANTWLGKFDPAGAPVWEVETPLGPENFQTPLEVAVGPDGVIHVLDMDYAATEDGKNQVRRFTADGEPLGVTTLPARPKSIAATADGVLVGGCQFTGDNGGVAWLSALDGEGVAMWERTFGDPTLPSSTVDTIAVDGDELVLGGALVVEPTSPWSHAWLLRADVATGETVWEKQLSDAIAGDLVYDLGLAADGTIVALGSAAAAKFVRAFTPAGVELWNHAPTETSNSQRLTVGADGSFALTDGVFLPVDDPSVCEEVLSPCSIGTRVARYAADRSLRWFATRDECGGGLVAAVTPQDAVVVLADCGEGVSTSAMSLMLFAP